MSEQTEHKTDEAWQEITLPRREGRPPYILIIPVGALKVEPITNTAEAKIFNLSLALTDEQWAEYVEIPLDKFLRLKTIAMEKAEGESLSIFPPPEKEHEDKV